MKNQKNKRKKKMKRKKVDGPQWPKSEVTATKVNQKKRKRQLKKENVDGPQGPKSGATAAGHKAGWLCCCCPCHRPCPCLCLSTSIVVRSVTTRHISTLARSGLPTARPRWELWRTRSRAWTSGTLTTCRRTCPKAGAWRTLPFWLAGGPRTCLLKKLFGAYGAFIS